MVKRVINFIRNNGISWVCMIFGFNAWAAPVSFIQDVAPILEANCLSCHNTNLRKGKISLSSPQDLISGKYIVSGDPEKSDLISIVSSEMPGEPPEMPKKGDPLSAAQVEILKQWIQEGADWPESIQLREPSKGGKDWWAFQPISEPPLPDAKSTPEKWSQHPIDLFVYEKLKENQLQPSNQAEPRALLRRLSYDLNGLPPSPEDLEAFESNPTDDAYLQWVNRYLDSPRYGERWGRHWLDVVRFGESRGFERNEIITNAWPFRDYIIRAFNEDRPWNQVIKEHLAGDVIAAGDPAREIGSAFLVCGPYDDVGNQDPEQAAQIRANTIDDMIRATGEAFLGLTIGCARCHDHKFDPVLQEDYYRFYSIFAGVNHGSRVVTTPEKVKAYQAAVEPLERERNEIRTSISQLEEIIIARAELRKTELEKHWVRGPVERTGTEEVFEPVTVTQVRLIVTGAENNPRGFGGFTLDEFEVWSASPNPENVALASKGSVAKGASRVAEDFSDAYDVRLVNDGVYGARWLPSGPVLTIQFPQATKVDRVVFSSDRSGAAGDHGVASFVSEYRIEASQDGEKWEIVADSMDRKPVNESHRSWRFFKSEVTPEEEDALKEKRRQLAELEQKIREVPGLPTVWAGNFSEAPGPFHVFQGGNPSRKGKEVMPAGLDILSDQVPDFKRGITQPENERRLALAEWIVHPDNPLAARVLANRIWHYHFGRGLVETPSDFGFMGAEPSHPELLDWLASYLIQNDWRLKSLHRLILTSRTYRQSADYHEAHAKVDGESRWLWRFPPRRLSAEEIRDTFLWLSDSLDLRMGGQGFRLYQYLQDNVATYIPLEKHGPETYRRAVYHHNARAAFVDLLGDFDCPDNAFSAPRRSETVSPLQALTQMNHSFTLDMAGALAGRLDLEISNGEPADKIRRLFELAYGRMPDEEELQAALELSETHGFIALCRALLNSNELIYLN